MYAVVRTGGKQYKVTEGDQILVEKIEGNPGDVVSLNDVLMIRTDDGVVVGEEVSRKANIQAEIIGHEKGDKIIVFKYRPKKRYRRKTGHRQLYTRLKILSINYGEKQEKKKKKTSQKKILAEKKNGEN